MPGGFQRDQRAAIACLQPFTGNVPEKRRRRAGPRADLDNFWQETGATPSSNSLNAYVSAIRRGLSSLGIEQEAITTVYKVGFVFNPAIRIQKSALQPQIPGRTGVHFHIRYATQPARLLAVWRFYLAVTRRASSSAASEREKHHARQRRPA